MAKLVKALRALAPRINRSRTTKTIEIMDFIKNRTGFNESTIHGVLCELQATLITYLRTGQAVKLPGLGTYAAKVNMDGKIGMVYWPDRTILSRLNDEGAFTGTIQNHDMIGYSTEDLVDRWNIEHPDDPVEDAPTGKPGKAKN